MESASNRVENVPGTRIKRLLSGSIQTRNLPSEMKSRAVRTSLGLNPALGNLSELRTPSVPRFTL